MILLGAALALFVMWTLAVVMTAWAIVRILLLSIRLLGVLVFAFIRLAGSRRRVVVLHR